MPSLISLCLATILAAVAAPLAAAFETPGTQPQVAHDGPRVFMVSVAEGRVQVHRSRDGGRTFQAASPIVPAGRLAAGMRRGPRVAVTRDAVLVALIAGAEGGGKDGDVLVYRSVDEGATWSRPSIVNDIPKAAREGLHGLAATPDGRAVLAWLDLRQAGTRVFAAVSSDHGATWGPDILAYASPDGSVCECCHPSVAVSGAATAVMFRNHVAGARDLYVTRADAGQPFTAARKQGVGSWQLAACPMDGGAVALTANTVVSTWRREDGVFLTTPDVPERRIGTGRDPVLATWPAGLDLAWTTPDGVLLQRGSATRLVGPGRFPSLVALDTHTLLAVEHQGRVVVHVVLR